jgi:hypothetical protein
MIYTEILNLIVSALNVIAFITLSVMIHRYNVKKDAIDFMRQIPLISIEQNYNQNFEIKNIGSGPALNVKVLSNPDFEEKIWRINEIAYNIFNDGKTIELISFNKIAYLILYSDVHQNKYYSFMHDNIFHFGKVDDKKLPKEIGNILKFEKAEESFMNYNQPSV